MKQKFRCLLCGNLWTEKNSSKDVKSLVCPKCQKNKISIVKTRSIFNKVKDFVDSIASSIGKIIARTYFSTLKLIDTFIFNYSNDIKNLIVLVILILLIALLKITIFINEPFYILGPIVLAALLIIKLRF